MKAAILCNGINWTINKKNTIYIYNSGPATGTRGLVVIASALEKPGTWVRLPASVRFFLFIPLRPFFCAALAKRWKVQF